MEHYKIFKLLYDSTVTLTVTKFVTRKWFGVNNFSGNQYPINKNIRFKTPIPRSDLCDYSDAYIVLKGTITVGGTNGNNGNNQTDKMLAFNNKTPLRSCM